MSYISNGVAHKDITGPELLAAWHSPARGKLDAEYVEAAKRYVALTPDQEAQAEDIEACRRSLTRMGVDTAGLDLIWISKVARTMFVLRALVTAAESAEAAANN